ncbi:MAG: hypothetical protein IJT83_09225 [Victivallales bacterium]|nr:hypothetical protein [Victivallales bacterium]
MKTVFTSYPQSIVPRMPSHLQLLLALFLLACAGCRHVAPAQPEASLQRGATTVEQQSQAESPSPQTVSTVSSPVEAPMKVGFFVGNGSRGSGVFLLGQMLSHSPQVNYTLLDGQDLRDGKLDGLQLLLIPGGSSALQYKDMQEEGAEAVRKFVASGGSYFGVCAGFHCALNRDERIKLLPYTWYFGGDGLRAILMVELNEKAAERIQVPAGRYKVRYSRGPISKRCEQPGTGWAEELGYYRDEMPETKISFGGAPAMLYGEYGKGKVIATSFHPEFLPETRPIALGCVYAVTGRKITPVTPKKESNAMHVAYLTNGMPGKEWVEHCLALDKDSRINVQLASSITTDLLGKVDVIICPSKVSDTNKAILGKEQNAESLKEFVEKGGRLLVTKAGLPFAPKHDNVREIPVNADGKTLCDLVGNTSTHK